MEEKKKKMDEFEAAKCVREMGRKISTPDDVKGLVEKVMKDFNYEYGVAPRSLAAALVSIACYMSEEMGLTGFQASFVMWDFIRGYMKTGNKCGMKLVDYDDMLYPQYGHKFDKKISKETWKEIQNQAKLNLEKYENEKVYGTYVSPSVANHWKSIVDGTVPFGFEVEEEEE